MEQRKSSMKILLTILGLVLMIVVSDDLFAQKLRYKGRTLKQWQVDMSDLDSDTRINAIDAISTFGKDGVPILIQALADKNYDVRIYAIRALGTIGQEARDAVPALIKSLDDEYLTIFVAEALGKIGQSAEDAVPSLLERAKHEFKKDFKNSRYFDAVKYLEAAALIYPNNQEAHYLLGHAYDYLHDMPNLNVKLTVKASNHLQKVIEISPNYEGEIIVSDPYSKLMNVWGKQATTYLIEGKVDSAKWALKQSQSVVGFHPVILEYNKNMMSTCDEDAILFTDEDNYVYYTSLFLQLVYGYRPDIVIINLGLLNNSWYIRYLRDSVQHRKRFIELTDDQIKKHSPIGINPSTDDPLYLRISTWKTSRISVPVTKNSLNSEGKISWRMKPTYGRKEIRVQDLMIIHIINQNKWRYPIYFALSVRPDNRIGLDRYLQMEGLAFRLRTYKVKLIDYDKFKKNMTEKYLYENLENYVSKIYVVNFNPDIVKLVQHYRSAYIMLASHVLSRYQVKQRDPITTNEELQQLRQSGINYLDLMSMNIPDNAIPLTSSKIKFQIGSLYLGLEQFETAQQIYETMYAENPSQVEVLGMLLKIYDSLKYWDKAIDLLEEWLEHSPRDSVARELLKKYYESSGSKGTDF